MPESKASRLDYPTTLDVVKHGGQEVQIVASVQTGTPKNDVFLVKNTQTGETYRVKGAKFVRQKSQDPAPGLVHRVDEGVRITGLIQGGKKQE